MSNTRNSEIILSKNIKLDKEYNNVLSYSHSDMLALLKSESHLVSWQKNYSFLRHTEDIYVQVEYEKVIECNYMAFQNPNYSNRWFFAFIDDIKYEGEKNVKILYTIDAWATFFGDWTQSPCFVEREHVNNDTVGANIVDENLDIGELITDGAIESIDGLSHEDVDDFCVCIASNYDPYKDAQFNGVIIYNGNVMATPLYLFKTTTYANLIQYITVFLAKCNVKGHIEDVKDLFFIPAYLLGDAQLTEREISQELSYIDGQGVVRTNTFTGKYYDFPESGSPMYSTELFTRRLTFSDYTPKNNKLKTYPFNFLQISNNAGNVQNYRFEDFEDVVSGKVQFRLDACVSVGCSGRLYPMNYKGKIYELCEQIPLAKYPVANWSADSFTNWLTQQGVNTYLGAASNAGAGVFQMLGGNLVGGLQTLSNTFINTMGTTRQEQLRAEKVYGENTGDVNFLNGDNNFYAYRLRCKTYKLKMIDDFFSRCGYAIKNIKTPNLTGRQNWNYVEIGVQEAIGYGKVPSKYMEQINNACRKGVTIWHSHTNIGNYNLSNNIVS